MVELKEERRRPPPRRRTLKGARVVFNNRRCAIDCTVRNLSDHGALLFLPTPLGIPAEFELWLDGASHTARIVWKGGGRMGVAWC
ncbi:MAG: PilZ domain-containing protein [Methyloceanibacter sp.]